MLSLKAIICGMIINPWKIHFCLAKNHRFLMEQHDVILFQRNSVIKFFHLIHNQLCSLRYQEMWKYGWFGCGFIEEHPAMFLTPVEFCFEGSLRLNRCQHCEHLCFIVCSWCKTYLCFEHFWNLHFCTDYAI